MKDKSAGAGSGKKAGEVLQGAMEGIEKMVSGAGAKTKDFAAKTQKSIVNAMDKNDDGKIDMADFGMEKENIRQQKKNQSDCRQNQSGRKKACCIGRRAYQKERGSAGQNTWRTQGRNGQDAPEAVFPDELRSDSSQSNANGLVLK